MTPFPDTKIDDTPFIGRPYGEVVAEPEQQGFGRIQAVASDMMVTMDNVLPRTRVRYDRKTGLVTSVRRG